MDKTINDIIRSGGYVYPRTQKVFLVIRNLGDGSNCIDWFRNVTLEQLEALAEERPDEYSSGDGLQYEELTFPLDFNFEKMQPGFYWANEDEEPRISDLI